MKYLINSLFFVFILAIVAACEKKEDHLPKIKITSHKIPDDFLFGLFSNPYYGSQYSVIAHAGGGINGRRYTNSLEAIEDSIIDILV